MIRMESEDKVTSEVHCFSKNENFNSFNDDAGKICSSEKSKELHDDSKFKKSLSNDNLPYTCLLGANGQVVLWSPECETVLSRFEFSYPSHLINKTSPEIFNLEPSIDKDGDLDVVRKKDVGKKEGCILIEQNLYNSNNVLKHQSSTTLELVGEQVWRGALYLADFVLQNPKIFCNSNILEVASGVGLTSIVASMVAKEVILSDIDKGDIFDLIERNLKRNKEIIRAKVGVKEIDFFDPRTVDEVIKEHEGTNILLAADVVYHNQLTDAFLKTVLHLMKQKPNKTMFVALEKRFVFTIEDMDTVAPCYDYFVERLNWLKEQEKNRVEWRIEQLAADFPQYFTYERTKHLVIWKIESILK